MKREGQSAIVVNQGNKKLPFHKETLRQLSDTELSGVAGGHSNCGNTNSHSCNSCCNNGGGKGHVQMDLP